MHLECENESQSSQGEVTCGKKIWRKVFSHFTASLCKVSSQSEL